MLINPRPCKYDVGHLRRVWSRVLQHCYCGTFMVFFSEILPLCGSVWIWCIDLFYPLYSFSKPLESFLGDDIENVEQGPLGSRSLQSANKGTQMINHSELTLSLLLEAWSRIRGRERGDSLSVVPGHIPIVTLHFSAVHSPSVQSMLGYSEHLFHFFIHCFLAWFFSSPFRYELALFCGVSRQIN